MATADLYPASTHQLPYWRTRISLLRVGVVLLCTALVGWTGTRAISAAVSTPPIPGPSIFAAYVDVTATPTYPFETPPGPAQSNVIWSLSWPAPTTTAPPRGEGPTPSTRPHPASTWTDACPSCAS